MTTTVQPVPVGEKAKEGPNKFLLAILGILAAAALFMFVVKPLLFDSKPSAPAQAPATTRAQTDGAAAPSQSGTTKSGTATTAPGATGPAQAPAAPATGDGGDAAAPTIATPTSDALPQIPAQYAGQQARDPFAALVQGSSSSGGSSSKSK